MAIATSTIMLIPILLPFICGIVIFGFRKWFKSFAGELGVAIVIATIAFLGAVIAYMKNATNQILYGFFSSSTGEEYSTPIGVQLRADGISSWVALFLNIILIFIFVYESSNRRDQPSSPIYISLLLFIISGINAVLFANDFFTLFLAWVLIAVSLISLIAFNKGQDEIREGAVRIYIVMGLGLGLLLIATILCYGVFGSLNFDYVFTHSLSDENQLKHKMVIYLIITLIVISFGLFAQLFLLNLWIPNTMKHAPTSTKVMVSGFINSVAIFSMIRVLYGFFNPTVYTGINYPLVLAIIGVITSFEGIFLILNQLTKKENDEINIDSILIYSAIVNIGLTLTSLSFQGLLFNELSSNHIYLENIAYSYLQMVNLSATTIILFTCKERLSNWREGTNDLRKLQGISKELPITTLVFVVGLISNIGIIPTFGGIVKFMFLSSILQTDYLILSILVIIVILLQFICYLLIIKFMLFNKPISGRIMAGSVGDDLTLSTFSSLLIAIALIIFGLVPTALANGMVSGILQIFS